MKLKDYPEIIDALETPVLLLSDAGTVEYANSSAMEHMGIVDGIDTESLFENDVAVKCLVAHARDRNRSTLSMETEDGEMRDFTLLELGENIEKVRFITEFSEHMDMPVVLINAKGAVLHSNGVAKQFFALDDGTLLEDFLHGNTNENSFPGLMQEASGGIEATKYTPFFCKSTESDKSWVLASVVPVDKKNELYSCFFIDISAQRTQEQWINMGRLARSTVHDVNNILTRLLFEVETMLEDVARDEMTAEKAQQKKVFINELLTTIIGSLKGFMELSPRELEEKEYNDISPGEIIGFLKKHFASTCKKYAISLEHMVLGEDSMLHVHPHSFKSALVNLVNNAIDAITERGPDNPPREGYKFVNLTFETTADHISIFISDNGKGMTEEQRINMFRPFYTTKAQGTGIGLENVKATIEELGGEISASSREGKGTTITIVLPRGDSEVSSSADEPAVEQSLAQIERSFRGLFREHNIFVLGNNKLANARLTGHFNDIMFFGDNTEHLESSLANNNGTHISQIESIPDVRKEIVKQNGTQRDTLICVDASMLSEDAMEQLLKTTAQAKTRFTIVAYGQESNPKRGDIEGRGIRFAEFTERSFVDDIMRQAVRAVHQV